MKQLSLAIIVTHLLRIGNNSNLQGGPKK